MVKAGEINCFLRFEAEDYCGAGCWYDGRVYAVKGDIFDSFIIGKKPYDSRNIKYLPPCNPQKIICVGLNYVEHASESTLPSIPEEPVLFFKPPSALIGHRDKIILPSWVDRVDYEGELGIVIGRRMRYVKPEEAMEGVFGYTCINDVTARNMQKKDNQWTRAKGFDTFCPVGPHIVRNIDPSSLELETRLNGRCVQKSDTAMMLRKPAEIISFISQVMTLYPGDIIATGTPKGVGPLKDGDRVEVVIEKIGNLTNTAVAEKS